MITTLDFKKAVSTYTPTNHVFVADVSGSMYSALPKIREHLKRNLASLVKPDDTVSILYFSGKGQYGSVFVGEKVNSLNDLTTIHSAIDRYLKPTGLTAFVEPLKMAAEIADELSNENNNLNSLIFMTDGYDNQWGETSILGACQALPLTFTNITFLEYGWYCNRPLLEKMSEVTNALHTFAESYAEYEPAFEEALTAITAKRIEVEVGTSTHAIYIDEDRIHTVNAVNGIALVPEHISQVWAVGAETIDFVDEINDLQLLYTVLYYGVHTMNPDLVWKVLKKLGDVRLIKAYDNCFTKQDYSNVKDMIADTVIKPETRFIDGIDYDMVPNENAVTIGDVLTTLIEADALVDIKSEHFLYNRTGRSSTQKADDTIAQLSEQIANAETSEERQELALQLAFHKEWTPEFKSDQKTVPMNKLVTNSSRPNISIQTDMKGTIDIPVEFQNEYGLPAQVDSKIYRNYTMVKDGIVNMKKLPVIVPTNKLADIIETGVKFEVYNENVSDIVGYRTDGQTFILVHLDSVPLVNRSMAKGISGEEYMRNAVNLQYMKARQKVLKFYRDQMLGTASNALGLAALYGKDAANFLSSKGIRDYGFAPKTERTESTDVYMSKELNFKIKGLSSLPAVNAVQKKIDAGKKLNAGDHVMSVAMSQVSADTLGLGEEETKQYFINQTKATIQEVRDLEQSMSRTMYGIVVAKSWFADLDFENSSMDITEGGYTFPVTVVLEEKEIKL